MEDNREPLANCLAQHDKEVQTQITIIDKGASSDTSDASVMVIGSLSGAGALVESHGFAQLEQQFGLLHAQLSKQMEELANRMEERLASLQSHMSAQSERLGQVEQVHAVQSCNDNDSICGILYVDQNLKIIALQQQPQESLSACASAFPAKERAHSYGPVKKTQPASSPEACRPEELAATVAKPHQRQNSEAPVPSQVSGNAFEADGPTKGSAPGNPIVAQSAADEAVTSVPPLDDQFDGTDHGVVPLSPLPGPSFECSVASLQATPSRWSSPPAQRSLESLAAATSGTTSPNSFSAGVRITRSSSEPHLMSAPRDLLDTGRLLPPLRFSIAHSGSDRSEHGPLCSERTAELEQRCSEGAAMSSMELEPTCSEWDATNSFEELEPTCSERQARSSFAELCQALQGRWVEVGGKRKRWTVDGHNATSVVERGRCFNPVVLTRSADGGLNWGNGNMFYLDRLFDRSSGRAIWRRHQGGTEAFVWKALDNTSMELEPTCSEWEATNSFEELEPTCSEMQARSSFEELCQALQGRWVEVGGKRKLWTVDGHNATPVVRGRCPYPVVLTRSADGGLNWGNGNMFYLDRQFDRCSGRAIWRRHPDGTEAFVWKALDNADELPGLLGPPDERRLDPDRQEAYSWDEMCAVLQVCTQHWKLLSIGRHARSLAKVAHPIRRYLC